MKQFKHLLFISILCSLVLFTNCGDSDDPVADDDNSTDDVNTDDSSTDSVTYTLTLSASEGGTVTPESGTYSENESVELLATPDSTYVFAYWIGSLTSTDNPLSVTMDADKNFTANFEKKQYPLTIVVEGEGAVTEEIVTNGRVEDYDVGTLVQLTATPSEGWKFDKWVEIGVDTNPLQVAITDSITLTAKFYNPTSLVKNLEVTDILYESALFSAEYENEYDGSDITTKTGFVISASSSFTDSVSIQANFENQKFNIVKDGLSSNTTYYIKAFVENEFGKYVSDVQSFQTLNGGYNFITSNSTKVGYDSAVLTTKYNQISEATIEVSEKGFLISENQDMSNELKFIATNNDSEIVVNAKGLLHNKQYYAQAYLTNTYGTFKGEKFNFTTLNASPVISAKTENINLTDGEAKINFSFQENTSATSINLILKKPQPIFSPTVGTYELDLSSTEQTFKFENLDTKTLYEYTITVTNQFTTYTSQGYSFITLDDTPTITLDKTAGLDVNSIILNASITPSEFAPTFSRIYIEYKNNEATSFESVELNNETLTISETLNNLVQGPEYTFRLVVINDYNTYKTEIYYNLPVTYVVGDIMFGGVIVEIDASGYHGLVVGEPDKDVKNLAWATIEYDGYQLAPGAYKNGKENTQLIIDYYAAIDTVSAPAAEYCANFTKSGYNDWFLPAYYELKIAQGALYDKYQGSNASLFNNLMTSNTLPMAGNYPVNTFGFAARAFNVGNADAFGSGGRKNFSYDFLPMREF